MPVLSWPKDWLQRLIGFYPEQPKFKVGDLVFLRKESEEENMLLYLRIRKYGGVRTSDGEFLWTYTGIIYEIRDEKLEVSETAARYFREGEVEAVTEEAHAARY